MIPFMPFAIVEILVVIIGRVAEQYLHQCGTATSVTAGEGHACLRVLERADWLPLPGHRDRAETSQGQPEERSARCHV